ncbi:MAG: hypothetical protein ABIP03_02930, partial [Aquihabitans sp.]
APKSSHPEWSGLPDDERHLVRVAAGLLRIAIGLDRSHHGLVAGVSVDQDGGTDGNLVVRARPSAAYADLGLDLFAANERCGLLADVLGVEVSVDVDTIPPDQLVEATG